MSDAAPMSVSFARLWQQQEYSDLNIVLTVGVHADQEAQACTQLAVFPGHKALLSTSQVFEAQILRWQDKQPASKRRRTRADSGSSSSSSGGSGTDEDSRTQLVLELQELSEQTSAMAVLSSLYLTKPLPELLSELTQEQQLQAALLADKWQVPNVSTAATKLLVEALNTEGGLSEAVKHRIMSAQALPDCLQPFVKSVLLSVLGDLEAAWADAALQVQLLGLSLPCMELLLSFDELKVTCEDTVLYTMQQYLLMTAAKTSALEQEKATKQLAPLIRCQHLSQYWLVASTVLSEGGTTVLGHASTGLRKQLGELLMLRCAKPGLVLQPSDLETLLPGAPASWGLGARLSKPVSGVSFTWMLQVSKLKEAALRCVAEQKTVWLTSLPAMTPPLGGIAFKGLVSCVAKDGGCQVGVFVGSNNTPSNGFYSFTFIVVAARVSKSGSTPTLKTTCWGFFDFFEIGVMAGGWDEVAWSGKGLPASGDLPIAITVTKLAHMQWPAPAHGPAQQGQ